MPNGSARLCRLVSPKGDPSSPVVLNFVISVFEPCSKQVRELYDFHKDAVRAMQERVEQMRLEGEKLHVRSMKQPNRYRDVGLKQIQERSCRNVCIVSIFLFHIFIILPIFILGGGSRNLDKKPHYCSKKCQKSDGHTGDPDVMAQSGPKSRSAVLRVPV